MHQILGNSLLVRIVSSSNHSHEHKKPDYTPDPDFRSQEADTASIEKFVKAVSSDTGSSFSSDTTRTGGSTSSLIHSEPPSSEELEVIYTNLKSILQSLTDFSQDSESLEILEQEISECNFNNQLVYQLVIDYILSEETKANVKEKLLNTFSCSGDNIFYFILRKVVLHTEDIEVIKKFIFLPELDINLANKDGVTPLEFAVCSKNLAIVQCLVEAGANVNMAIENGSTPLHFAVWEKNLPIAQCLVDAGANVNMAMENGSTPLHFAVWEKNLSIAQCLVEAGANLNQIDKGWHLLYIAVQEGNLELVKLLVSAGANIDHVDKYGLTLLHLAALRGNLVAVECLLEAGADINKTDEKGSTPLHEAVWEGHVQVAQHLLRAGAAVDHIDKDGRTPLLIASQEGYLEIMKCLVDAGADVNQIDKFGFAPFHNVALYGHTQALSWLLEEGRVIVDQATEEGLTPLWIAALQGHLEVVKYLVGLGANVDQVAVGGGSTALYAAALQGHLEVVKYLVGLGVNVDQVAVDGSTALHVAALQGHVEVVQCLLGVGANVNQADEDGATPLHAAGLQGRLEVVQCLLGAGANVNQTMDDGATPLHAAAKGPLDIKEELLKVSTHTHFKDLPHSSKLLITQLDNPDVEQGLIDAISKVFVPAGQDFVKVVQLLVDYGANINQTMADGSTPLHLAAAKGNSEIANLLLKNKANMMLKNEAGQDFIDVAPEEKLAEFINLQDMHNNSLLHHAIMLEDWRFFNWLLQQPDININIQDDEGRTPLSIAEMHDMSEYVKSLLDISSSAAQAGASSSGVHVTKDGLSEQEEGLSMPLLDYITKDSADYFFLKGKKAMEENKIGKMMYYFKQAIQNIGKNKNQILLPESEEIKILIEKSIEHGKFDNLKTLIESQYLTPEIFKKYNQNDDLIKIALHNFLSGDYILIFFIDQGYLTQSDCSEDIVEHILYKCLRRAGEGSMKIINDKFLQGNLKLQNPEFFEGLFDSMGGEYSKIKEFIELQNKLDFEQNLMGDL